MTKKTNNPTIEEEYQAALRNYYYIPHPTISFEVGERVQWGAHDKAEIVLKTDLLYYVRAFGTHSVYGQPKEYEQFAWLSWLEIEKLDRVETNFAQKEDIFFQFQNRQISSLLLTYYKSGIDTEPDYQRGRVWKLQDKVDLIHSIFNNIEIGKFAIIHLPYRDNSPSYEILDGKQRLLALSDFYEGRFTYNGYRYKQLGGRDQDHFDNYSISWAEVRDITQKQKYEYFLKLNTRGVSVDQSHLDYVYSLWKIA